MNHEEGVLIGLLQRVSEARVTVAGETVGEIGAGLAVLVGVERGDGEAQADRLLERLLGYRVFPDAEGRMNRSLRDTGGGLLLVPQFTLAADTAKGTRPSFGTAAPPEEGERLFGYLLARAREHHAPVASGRFGADMQVTLTNDGPVTFWLQAAPKG
jgi:D-tyrosyl-tRNA(Tyr) deacylase